MALGLPFDYVVVGSNGLSRRVRFTRARNPTFYSADDYDKIAVLIWSLSKMQALSSSSILLDQAACSVAAGTEITDDTPSDIDASDVCRTVGKDRLLALAAELGESRLRFWLEQEADLIEECDG